MNIEKIDDEDDDIILDKEINELLKPQPSVELDKTFTHIIKNYSFDDIPENDMNKHYKDGRYFAPLI